MDYRKCKLAILEDKYTLRILICLLNEGRLHRTELYGRIANTTTPLVRRVNMLIENGLIIQTIDEAPPLEKFVELSDKGREIAESLLDIEKTLQ